MIRPVDRPESKASPPYRRRPLTEVRGRERHRSESLEASCPTLAGGLWRRGRDSNPRCFRTPLFESGTINHSDTSPRERIPEASGRAPSDDGPGAGRDRAQTRWTAPSRSSSASARRMPLTTWSRRAARDAGRAGGRFRRPRRSSSGPHRPAPHVAGEEGADAHRAGLHRREHRDVAELGRAESAGRLTQGADDRMGGGVVRLADPIMGSGDHRVVDDGDRRDRTLAPLAGQARLGQGLAHEQFVVHAPDDTGRPPRVDRSD